ncbi:MAG: Fic family protein [Alphaproteobacteria bacterium]|nr:Fic family protein [Alphaproteobacteria bacterium]MBQ5524445.1 Fic family protein [Paludibacteraceae bacterium]
MFEKEEIEYQKILKQYNESIVSKMDAEALSLRSEVMFSAHSCGIEGNSYSVDDSFALKELELGYVPKNKPLVETMEMLDHFHAYEYMVSTKDEPLTEEYIKHLHFLLTEHTITYRHPDTMPGEYTNTDMGAGDTIFGDHTVLIKRVPDLLKSTNNTLEKGSVPPMFISAIFHGYFIYLHPFRDGNGRLGRLLSNKILMQVGLPPIIIKREEKEEYIRCLKLFKKDSTDYLVGYFYKTAISQMKEELQQKAQNNNVGGFSF